MHITATVSEAPAPSATSRCRDARTPFHVREQMPGRVEAHADRGAGRVRQGAPATALVKEGDTKLLRVEPPPLPCRAP